MRQTILGGARNHDREQSTVFYRQPHGNTATAVVVCARGAARFSRLP